jgi:hypothetical protein
VTLSIIDWLIMLIARQRHAATKESLFDRSRRSGPLQELKEAQQEEVLLTPCDCRDIRTVEIRDDVITA